MTAWPPRALVVVVAAAAVAQAPASGIPPDVRDEVVAVIMEHGRSFGARFQDLARFYEGKLATMAGGGADDAGIDDAP